VPWQKLIDQTFPDAWVDVNVYESVLRVFDDLSVCVCMCACDVASTPGRRCRHPGCSKVSNFGLEGGRPECCRDHKAPNMINVVRRKCVVSPVASIHVISCTLRLY
jgi:hypothetical protein